MLGLAAPLHAATLQVNGGALTMDLDRGAWASLNGGTGYADNYDGAAQPAPGLYLEEFFDQQAAAALPANQLGTADPVPGRAEVPSTGLRFAVNGATVSNLPGHHDQPTNFTFDPAAIGATANGVIGLGGVMRFRGNFGDGIFALGEFGLKYDPAAAINGASGWVLRNNVTFGLNTFDLLNVSVTSDAGGLALRGDLRLAPEAAAAFFAPDDAAKILGTVSLQATTVPVPAAVWLFGSAVGGMIGFGRRVRTAAHV